MTGPSKKTLMSVLSCLLPLRIALSFIRVYSDTHLLGILCAYRDPNTKQVMKGVHLSLGRFLL